MKAYSTFAENLEQQSSKHKEFKFCAGILLILYLKAGLASACEERNGLMGVLWMMDLSSWSPSPLVTPIVARSRLCPKRKYKML